MIHRYTNILFQYIICCWFKNISIQEWFDYNGFQYIICCWFNKPIEFTAMDKAEFQYIICCWFKKLILQIIKKLLGFNTLYVVGSKDKEEREREKLKFQYIICCWFKKSWYHLMQGDYEFQYIICCWFKLILSSLNS